jgi:hypothetical protein
MSTRSSVYYDGVISIYLEHLDDSFRMEVEADGQCIDVPIPKPLIDALSLKYEKGILSYIKGGL